MQLIVGTQLMNQQACKCVNGDDCGD